MHRLPAGGGTGWWWLHPELKTTNQTPSGKEQDNDWQPQLKIVYATELPGTPERVWEAVTAGTPGWMFPTDQWPDVKTVHEYPTHLVSRMDGCDGWFNQLEHVLEPLDGGCARLYYVHSGIFADNWDQQYDGASRYTEFYLHTLGQYLQYFDGKPVVFTDIQGPAAPEISRRQVFCASGENRRRESSTRWRRRGPS